MFSKGDPVFAATHILTVAIAGSGSSNTGPGAPRLMFNL